MLQNWPSIMLLAIGISGLAAIGLTAYWVFKKEAKKRHLEELRRMYENMSPADPQYNTARALFMAAVISDASTGHNFESEAGSNGAGSIGDGQGDD